MSLSDRSSLRNVVCALWVTLLCANAPAFGAEDLRVERMVTCRDSWLDWQKNDPALLKSFGDHFRSTFLQNENDQFFVPKSSISIAGLRILKVFPGTVGMGVGFSVFVDANYDIAKRSLERTLGSSLKKCEVSDGMRACELEIGEKRTFMLMAEDSAKSSQTLIGCYYYYEK